MVSDCTLRFHLLNRLADLLKEPPKLDLDAYIANYRGKRLHISTIPKRLTSDFFNRPNAFRTIASHWDFFVVPLPRSTESSHC